MSKWYVATMNDCIFIIDQKPRPAPVDYMTTEMDCGVCISMQSGSKQVQALAELIVEAHNLSIPAAVKPRSRSKKQKIEDALRQSDLTAQIAERDDIEYGHHESLPRGEHVARRGSE